MSAITTQSELRLTTLLDERETTTRLHEAVIAEVEKSDNKLPSESQAQQLRMYREKGKALDEEIEELTRAVEDNRKAVEASKAIRRVLAGNAEGVEVDGDSIVYRSFAHYARDVILTEDLKSSAALRQRVGHGEVEAAKSRLQLLKRAPANTLSSNVEGLIPDQHIAQIFQVIDDSRPIVASATRTTLERGTLTFPKITQRPLVAVQATEKTEAGNQGMIVGMETSTASTYLGGGDLSWQAINWSTPDALDLWFRLAAADYALKTESDAAEVVEQAGFLNNISSTLGATPTYAQFVTAVAAGAGDVYANSGRMADTLYMAPDRFYYLAGLTSDVASPFGIAGRLSLGSQSGDFALNIVVSRGMDSGAMVVGDSEALIVAETAGAPVELRVVEPAIGGVEVGIIGAFEAVVVEDEAFALITTAS
jgi:HK97 family phage major capsid protein